MNNRRTTNQIIPSAPLLGRGWGRLPLYFKQAWQLMKQNRFYSAVYIIGTALAISLVMVMAIVYHIKTANIAPEVNRNRMLIADKTKAQHKNGGQYSWYLSYQTVKECFYSLEKPEIITAGVNPEEVYIRIPGSEDVYEEPLRWTDADFWNVFEFRFISGMPYTQEDFESGVKRIVLNESLARKLYGSTDIQGKPVMINEVEYHVCGVVRDISSVMSYCYSKAWIPFTSMQTVINTAAAENIVGAFHVIMLAGSAKDFESINAEIEQKRIQYNASLRDYSYEVWDNITQTVVQRELWSMFPREKYHTVLLRFIVIALIFLFVPAINLSGLTSSRMQERISELGIRKAFGANKRTLATQVLTENLLLTFIGGLVGLAVSYGMIFLFRNLLFGIDEFGDTMVFASFSSDMLINIPVFLYVFLICLLLNLISSLIPVWSASRKPIVQSLNN